MPQDNDEIDLTEAKATGKPFLKNGSYTIRCIGVEKKTSKKGNPMLVFQYEVCSPEVVKDPNGKDIKTGGLQATEWIVLADTGYPKLKALHTALSLPMKLNKTSPDLKQYLGKAVKVSLMTEPRVLKDENTGEPMLDDKNEPITTNDYRIQRYLAADLEHTVAPEAMAF